MERGGDLVLFGFGFGMFEVLVIFLLGGTRKLHLYAPTEK